MIAGGSVSWRRRAFLQGLLSATCAGALAAPSQGTDRTDTEGMSLVPWRGGQLDIHHISTGRGDASLIIGPDGMVRHVIAKVSPQTHDDDVLAALAQQ